MIASLSGNVEVARLLQSASEDVADTFCGDNTDAHMIKSTLQRSVGGCGGELKYGALSVIEESVEKVEG